MYHWESSYPAKGTHLHLNKMWSLVTEGLSWKLLSSLLKRNTGNFPFLLVDVTVSAHNSWKCCGHLAASLKMKNSSKLHKSTTRAQVRYWEFLFLLCNLLCETVLLSSFKQTKLSFLFTHLNHTNWSLWWHELRTKI